MTFSVSGKERAFSRAREKALLPETRGSKASGARRPPYSTVRAFILLIISAFGEFWYHQNYQVEALGLFRYTKKMKFFLKMFQVRHWQKPLFAVYLVVS
jgi:hypothetical protein